MLRVLRVYLKDDFDDSDMAYFYQSRKAFKDVGYRIIFTRTERYDVIVSKPTAAHYRKIVPKDLWLLSATDRTTKPYKIYINALNWTTVPKESEYTTLDSYRTALLSHELAHALGFDHVGCRSPGLEADVRQQPSLSLHGCRPTTKVIIDKMSPKRN